MKQKSCEIKVVVFDFDDTLYSGVDWTNWHNFCKNYVINATKHLNKKKRDEILSKMPENADGGFVVDVLYQNNLNVKKWLVDRTSAPLSDYSKAITASNHELEKFAKNHNIYIVSNSTVAEIYQTSEMLNIDLTHFKRIFANTFKNGSKNKAPLYEKIIRDEKIKPSQLLVIGDNYELDIIPALEIGARGKLIGGADFIKYDQIMESIE